METDRRCPSRGAACRLGSASAGAAYRLGSASAGAASAWAGLALLAALTFSTPAAAADPPLPPATPSDTPSAAPDATAPPTPEAAPQPAAPETATAEPLPPATRVVPEAAPRSPQAPEPPPDKARDNLMVVTGGLALVGLGLGSVFGGLAISKWDDVQDAAKQGCRVPATYSGCTQEVGDMQVKASSFATVSTFCFLAGSAALGGTILLWVTGRNRQVPVLGIVAVAPAVAPGVAGGLLKGSF